VRRVRKVRRVLSLVIAIAGALVARPAAQAALGVTDAVNAYAAGQFDVAVRGLNARGLTVSAFTKALDNWRVERDEPRRTTIAAAFALDVTWRTTRTTFVSPRRNLDPWRRVIPGDADKINIGVFVAQPLVAQWVAQRLSTSQVPDDLNRALWRTAVALAEDASAWHQLSTDILPLAATRASSDPRLKLAAVVAAVYRDLGPLREQTARRPDLLRDERVSQGDRKRIPAAVARLEGLLSEPSLSGEVHLRIGYLHLRAKDWAAARTSFAAAEAAADQALLRASASYFSGWTFEQTDQRGPAIDAYRRAVATMPTQRNAATRLAALLYLDNQREEAFTVLERGLAPAAPPMDPVIVIERGDARFVPEWIATIRGLLR
jgi:hypothetical protein